MSQRVPEEYRIELTADVSQPESGVPAWGRFLLRLAAIGWPLMTVWGIAATNPRVTNYGLGYGESCTPWVAPWAALVLSLAGTGVLVGAVSTTGRWQQRLLFAAAVLAAVWVGVELLRWDLPLWCSSD
ncbi:MAG TPA: hypothetical protein VGO48_13425 [Conexibacter sp.]|jgi:hypothetical protein|nr:hypothetical protein [Conexibacter sp.]